VVRHNGQEVKYDWSKDSCIQWAAFYGDCEHEVLPVTSGYRVTITYNLYFGSPHIHRQNMIQTCSSLPLHHVLSKVLKSPDFMPDGGVLGLYCSHDYAHTSSSASTRLPSQMKGMDATILRICETFDLNTEALPVYNCEEQYEYEERSDIRDLVYCASDPVELFSVRPSKKQRVERDRDGDVDWIGSYFEEVHEDTCGDYQERWLSRLQDSNSFSPYHGIQWLNGPKYWETNMATIHVQFSFTKFPLTIVWK
jgi:hypothetical protein